MLTEKGFVEEVLHGKAVVRIQRSSACAHCESAGSCQVVSDKEMMVMVDNGLQARVGDLVEIGVPSGSVLKISFLVYFVPVIALIAGAYAGGAWAEFFHVQSTLAAIGGAGLAMGITFYGLIRLDRITGFARKYQPSLTRIVSSAKSTECDDNK